MRRRRHWLLIVVLAAAAPLAGCVKWTTMHGHSMEPALQDGATVTLLYAPGRAERGDIVTFRWPKDESRVFVQRVVGLPGEAISSVDGHISVNGKPLDEPYVAEANRSHDSWPAVQISPGSYFVMGDHRNNASDSRFWGTVSASLIQARVLR